MHSNTQKQMIQFLGKSMETNWMVSRRQCLELSSTLDGSGNCGLLSPTFVTFGERI